VLFDVSSNARVPLKKKNQPPHVFEVEFTTTSTSITSSLLGREKETNHGAA
jgi:hypothetical protein